ncbi:hypothetical protein [Actinopolymorpha cephalotaxi]|uniref:Uncharacterized protein n=1 Tax=Actinopolymorpha cephalotaxi TaxID=504797 RepID=A0ABX2S9V3_9ACTN|nr:hypothetical protein [Actinopolymorpha cephalotaxi]NYH84869.1 hypothetical protein [Actinopolymorpha cephalotaxi]
MLATLCVALGTALGVRGGLWIATVGATAGVLWLLTSPIPRLRRIQDGH